MCEDAAFATSSLILGLFLRKNFAVFEPVPNELHGAGEWTPQLRCETSVVGNQGHGLTHLVVEMSCFAVCGCVGA